MDKASNEFKKPWNQFGFGDIINYILLGIIAFITFFPFWNAVVLSFNDGKDAMLGGIYFWPRQFTLNNYTRVLQNAEIWRAFTVSISRTVLTTACNLLVTSLFAFAVSKSYLLFRKLYLVVIIISMYFNGGLIPTFLVVRNLGLINNFLVYVIPGIFSIFYAQIFMSFFKGMPEALDESAKIDGANEWTIYFRIILPLSKPVLSAVGLFVAIGQWNAWYDNMLYMKNPAFNTLSFLFIKMVTAQQYLENVAAQTGIQELDRLSGVNSTSLQLATMMVAVVPILMIYPFAQKYFTKGVMIGSVKG